jgi:hypothetical protein
MRRLLSIAVGVLFMMGAAGTALASSKCDAGVVKATGKKAACECSANAKAIKKATAPDHSKCVTKFTASCGKAKSAGDCMVQTGTCASKEADVDAFVASDCAASPSGAFLE